MAVLFDTFQNAANSTSSPKTWTITIGSITNGCVAVHLGFTNNTATASAVSVGGIAGTLVPGTDTGSSASIRTQTWSVPTGSLTGAQTVSVTWSAIGSLGGVAVSASGVNQTTPMNNGTLYAANNDADGNGSVNVTSNSGDLTTSVTLMGGATIPTTNQTSIAGWSGQPNGTDRGPGTTGPITHTWTTNVAATDIAISGANFVASQNVVGDEGGMMTQLIQSW